jgi:hypothetical protein
MKAAWHMPEDKHVLASRKGNISGVAYASTPSGDGKTPSLKFKTQ